MKMRVPQGGSGCSFDGKEYKADKEGFVNVPDHAAPHLVPHGFTVVGGHVEPTVEPTAEPTVEPTAEPTAAPQKGGRK